MATTKQTITRLTRILPTPVYLKLRYAGLSVLDVIDSARGLREPMIPPRRLMLDGPPSVELFRKSGQVFLGYYKELCGLRPDSSILDVGSGMGRKTVALTDYLNSKGSYHGLDIYKPGIDWCQSKITPRFPNFQFQKLDVYNKYYNPGGRFQASEYVFPFPDNTFDFVVLTSVFTHMVPPDVDHYLAEISRTMKPGASCLISYFLLNEGSKRRLHEGKTTVVFPHAYGEHLVEKLETPEDAICFSESWLRGRYTQHGLAIDEPVKFGSWSGVETPLDYQDLVIAKKA